MTLTPTPKHAVVGLRRAAGLEDAWQCMGGGVTQTPFSTFRMENHE
jgi:hypothetical protein